MSATVMKMETEAETCCVCGSGGELVTPEEYDAGAPPVQIPLRTMLLQLNNNKVIPEGRMCMTCVQRATEAFEFSSSLSARPAQPLSDKIRALRRRLHELTQKIDVFIVVGGPGTGTGGTTGAYSEEDIIMVEKEALAAAVEEEESSTQARNARGDQVYQCSVCPLSFQLAREYRMHASTHPADALHSCWTCGAQYHSRDELLEHAELHAPATTTSCELCHIELKSAAERRQHTCPARCPACLITCASRAALAAHVRAAHGRAGTPPHVCPVCFRTCASPALLSAHVLAHRIDKQFVCGYADCVLRFANRTHLMAHIRKCHAAELPAEASDTPETFDCPVCSRTFASSAALKRHSRVHRDDKEDVYTTTIPEEVGMEYLDELDGDVEYLEVETLEEGEEGEGEEEQEQEYKVLVKPELQ